MAHYLAADVVRGEPDYMDQVPRLASYRHAHPDAEILYLGSWWQYILREGNGLTVVVRFTLEQLMDRLESLDAEDRAPLPPRGVTGRAGRHGGKRAAAPGGPPASSAARRG